MYNAIRTCILALNNEQGDFTIETQKFLEEHSSQSNQHSDAFAPVRIRALLVTGCDEGMNMVNPVIGDPSTNPGGKDNTNTGEIKQPGDNEQPRETQGNKTLKSRIPRNKIRKIRKSLKRQHRHRQSQQ